MKKALDVGCSLLVAVVAMAGAVAETPQETFGLRPKRIACIGDSITYGYLLEHRDEEGYPRQLQLLLDGVEKGAYEVRNFGNPGRGVYLDTLRGSEKRGFRWMKEHQEALAWKPDVVISNLGINDIFEYAKEFDGGRERGQFRKEYELLLGDYARLETKPRLFIWTKLSALTPVHSAYNHPQLPEMQSDLSVVAKKMSAVEIDMLAPFGDNAAPLLLQDGIHPNAAGAKLIARQTFGILGGGEARSAVATATVGSVAETSQARVSEIGLAATCESFLSVNCGLHFTDNSRFRVPEAYRGDLHRVTLDYLAQSGMRRARDFLGANQVVRKDGRFVFEGLGLNRLKNLYFERGIRPCVCLERLPSGVSAGATTIEDLVYAYDLGKAVAEHFAGKIEDWEIDNEIDQARAEASWEYATRAKAMALGFRAGNANVRLMPTSICLPSRGPFEAGMYANGLGYYYDTFNYHIYTAPHTHEQKFRELRAFLAKAGVPDLEIAVTETGCDIEGATEDESCVKGIGMHSPRQADLQAEFSVKNQISLMMQGACESHFFFFEALEERGNRKDWGMIRRDGTRKPAYYALQRLSQRIGQATLEGEVEVGSDERGYLFRQPDGSSTLVKWNVSPVDTGKGDPYGEPRDREIKYYDFAAEKQFTVMKRPIQVGKRGSLDPAGRDLSLVLKLNYDRKSFAVTGGKSTLEMKGGSGELTISAWNLSPVAKKGVIRARGGKLEGLPTGEVEIGPFTNASWTVVFTPEGWTNPEGRLEVVAVFNGRKSTKLSVPMICYADELLGDVDTYRPDAMNPELWQKNSNARTEEILWNEQEQALEFHAVWDPKDGNQWIYPVFKVPKGSLEGAIAAIFEMKSSQDKVENDFNGANLMIGPWLKYDPPMKVWETRRVPLAGIDLRECERFQLGGGPRGHDLRLFVRNLRFLKRK